MPLPPLAESNTIRGWLKYTNMGVEHELQFRLGPGATLSDMSLTGSEVATRLKGVLPKKNRE